MLHRGCDDPVTGAESTEQAEVDCFGGIGGKGNPAGIGNTEEPRYGLAALHDHAPGLQREVMTAAPRIGSVQP